MFHRVPTVTQDSDFQRYLSDGDARAFRRIVQLHLPAVLGTAGRVLGQHSGWADDVAQDVFLSLVRKAPSLQPTIVLSAWLHRQTVRRAIDVVRSEGSRRKYETEAGLNPTDSGDSSVWESIVPWLDRELLRLPEQDREALALRFMERCSSEEVGRRLGVTASAARKRVERALVQLRTRLVGPHPGMLSAAVLGIYLGAPAAKAASPLLVEAISSGCFTATPIASTGVLNLVIHMTKAQILNFAALIMVGGSMFFIGSYSSAKTPSDPKVVFHTPPARAKLSPVKIAGIPETKQGRIDLLENIQAELDPYSRNKKARDFLASLDPAQLQEVIAHLDGFAPNSWDALQREDIENMAFTLWAQVDPTAALEALSARPAINSTGAFACSIASVWGARDPAAALAWAEARPGYPGGIQTAWFMKGLLTGIAQNDPKQAVALLKELPPGTFSPQFGLESILPYVATKSPEEMGAWLDSVEVPDLKKAATYKLAGQLATEDPEAAARWLAAEGGAEGGTDSGDKGMLPDGWAEIYRHWAGSNPVAAQSYYETLPAGGTARQQALIGMLEANKWTDNPVDGSLATMEFVEKHPEDLNEKSWIQLFIGSGEPQFLLEHISALKDSGEQQRYRQELVHRTFGK